MNNLLFVRLDGDNIGDSIELSLRYGTISKAQETHDIVQSSIGKIRDRIERQKGSKILMVGCDDILFSIQHENNNIQFLDELNDLFFKHCKFTLSIGVGLSVNHAMEALRLSKLSRKNKVTDYRLLKES